MTRETLLLSTVRELSFAREIGHVMALVRSAARELTAADGVTFVLKEDGYCYYADEDAIAPLWKGKRFPLSECVSGWVMTHRESVALRDVYADPRIPQDVYQRTFVRSLLMVPVRVEDPIAAIGAYWATEHDATDAERAALEALAHAASLALLNVQLWTDLRRALEREQQARAAAEHAAAEARQANAVKDQFLATVSHELRTPLNVMQGWIWRLKQPSATPEQMTRGLEVLERNAALQGRLVEDLLDVSRAAGGKLRMDPLLMDLGSAARAVVDLARPMAEKKSIVLSFEDAGSTLVWGDRDRLQQVMWNLVENAIKFTPENGRVEVIVGRAEKSACITVRDTGIGIAPGFLPHMFDMFRQGDASTTREYAGLGIGLTIAQQLVKLHGGTIRAESAGKDQGTTVQVELPVPAVLSEPGAWLRRRVGADMPDRVSLDGLTILVVDDEPHACEALAGILEEHGATVYVARSVDDALALLERVTPSLVLSDLAMPGADGLSFIRKLREGSHPARDVPAAALTALVGSEYRREAEIAGFQLFLEKPVGPDELAVQLARLALRRGTAVH